MRTAAFVALLMSGSISAGNAATPSAHDFPAASFDRIVLDTAGNMRVVAGAGYSIHAEGNPSRVAKLTADVKDGILTLGSPGTKSDGREPLVITITLPHLAGLDLEGAGKIVADRTDNAVFQAVVGGAGSIDVMSVKAKRVEAKVSGSGNISLTGTAESVNIDLSGLGKIDVTELAASDGAFDLSGKGRIRATVDGPARVNLSGMGSVSVAGHSNCSIKKSGLGSVRCVS